MNNILDSLFSFFSLRRALLFIGVLAICFILELIFIGWKNSSLCMIFSRKSNSIKLDTYAYFFKLTNFIEVLGYLFSFGLSYWFGKFLGFPKFNLIQTYIPNIILQNVVFVLVLDFSLYWIHRTLHTFPSLWEIHKFHHSADEMSILTTARLHPIEIAINSIVFAIPIYLIGVPLENYVIFIIITSWLGHIQHSKLRWNFGFIGKWIFLSPNAHRIHHSKSEKHFNKNFGTVTPLWDRFFGTWHEEETHDIEIGLSDDVHNGSENIFKSYIQSAAGFLSSFNFRKK